MKQEVVQIAANLIINELAPRLKRKGIKIEESPVSPLHIQAYACMKYCEIITTRDIREMLDEAFR